MMSWGATGKPWSGWGISLTRCSCHDIVRSGEKAGEPAKVRSLIGVCTPVAGTLILLFLNRRGGTASIPTAQLGQRLLAIKGVGQYAMANLLMLLGRPDLIPVDSWACKVVSHKGYGGGPVGRVEVEAAFERWGEWKGLAYWFWDWSYTGEG